MNCDKVTKRHSAKSISPIAVGLILALSIMGSATFVAPAHGANPPHFKAVFFGDATVTSFQTFQVVRTDSVCTPSYPSCVSGSPGTSITYGGINFNLPDTMSIPLSSLTTLTLDFYALNGGVGGGSPRIGICLVPANVCGNNPNDFITGYLGPPPSFVEGPSSSFENDGNLVSMSNTDPRWGVDSGCDTLPHLPPGCYVPYSAIYAGEQAAYSNNARVYQIFLVTDGGWVFPAGSPAYTQTILFKNIHINNQVFYNQITCEESDGEGDFHGDHGNGHFAMDSDGCRDGDNDQVQMTDRGDGQNFQSTSVNSVAFDPLTNTLTITGVGTTNGLPVAFTLVALETGLATPGWVSFVSSDGFSNAGPLTSGAILLH